MPEAPIKFVNNQASGQDELGGSSPISMNIVVDSSGVIYRRPGLTASPLATSAVVDSSGIAGIYKTLDSKIWAVGSLGPERNIYRVTAGGSSAVSGTVGADGLRGTARPTFAETEMLLVMTGGDLPEKVVLSTEQSSRLGGTVPLRSTHVIANASRLLLNDTYADRTKERFSDTAIGTTDFSGHEVWSLGGIGTSGYFTAEGKPDPIVAVVEDTNEVLLFGQSTLQSFQPDPQVTYMPVSTREIGCSAPYSVVKVDQEFFWIDHIRRIVSGTTRGYQSMSDPIQRTLDAMSVSSDGWGAYFPVGFLDVLAYTFPADGRTFVFQKGAGWGQWSGNSNGNWAPLGVTCAYVPTDGTDVLVGTSDGKIGTFSLDASTDFGTPILASVTTGYENHGTEAQKHCEHVYITLRRGETSETTEPLAYLRFRDQPGAWSDRIPISLGVSGDTETVVPLHSLGVYRRRQWQFEYSGEESLALVSAVETYKVLSA